MHIIQSVLHAISLTSFQLCRQGTGVRVTAGSSGPLLSPPPSLPLSQLLQNLLHSSNITTLHRQTQQQWLLGVTKDTNKRMKNMRVQPQSQSFPFFSAVSL